MSLQVWLPLNGNLENKGVGTLSSDFSISSPTYSAGKTGNNLKISSQQSNVVTIDELTNKKNVTISFWFCPNSGNTFGQWRDVISFGVSNGTTVSSFRMEASSSTGKNFGWWGNGILTTDEGCFGYTLNLDTWYHITIVLNGTTIKEYINGGLQGTFTIPTSYANNYYFTGTMTLGDVSMYVSLADVRIYDECLSVKQIKEISKGLILHYPLNSGYGNENLLIGTNKFNDSGNASGITSSTTEDNLLKVVVTKDNGNWKQFVLGNGNGTILQNTMNVGDKFVVSFDMKIESGSGIPSLFINAGNGYQQMIGDANLIGTWQRVYQIRTWKEPRYNLWIFIFPFRFWWIRRYILF